MVDDGRRPRDDAMCVDVDGLDALAVDDDVAPAPVVAIAHPIKAMLANAPVSNSPPTAITSLLVGIMSEKPMPSRYGSANATSESPSLVPSLPWPPAAMTMNCLPSGCRR